MGATSDRAPEGAAGESAPAKTETNIEDAP